MFSYFLSLTSVLDGSKWSTPGSGRFTPGKDLVPIVQEPGWAPEPVWRGKDILNSTGIRSPDRQAGCESPYWPSYPNSLLPNLRMPEVCTYNMDCTRTAITFAISNKTQICISLIPFFNISHECNASKENNEITCTELYVFQYYI
jgi:hypothetical protein